MTGLTVLRGDCAMSYGYRECAMSYCYGECAMSFGY